MRVDVLQFRTEVLKFYGSSQSETEELLLYNQNAFTHSSIDNTKTLLQVMSAVAPEPYVEAWRQYEQEAQVLGVATALRQRLIQLQFPIQAGISETVGYQTATRRGILPLASLEPTLLVSGQLKGCSFEAGDRLSLQIYPSLAGAIPVITTGSRADFITLVQALTKRNEPHSIPLSMGACMVSGYNNWDRIKKYRQEWVEQWIEQHYHKPNESDWNTEFKQLIACKQLYQDRFIILSTGCYSQVSADEMGLTEPEWTAYSQIIRLEHECTHYFTLRFLGSMRNHLLDELIADYRGIVGAIGYYRADWFLRFVGLENYPTYRQGGRLENYRGVPPLSDSAFRGLQTLVRQAAKNLERFDQRYRESESSNEKEVAILIALTRLTLIDLAAESGEEAIASAIAQVTQETLQGSDKVLTRF